MRVPKSLDWLQRRATANWRCLPNRQIVGAQKNGTSSLYRYSIQHPNIHKSYSKEVHYFDGGLAPKVNSLDLGINWYRAHVPLGAAVKQGDICLDATPLYLFNPQVAKRIYECIPHNKIIILLRNPIERAISQYFFRFQFTHEFWIAGVAAQPNYGRNVVWVVVVVCFGKKRPESFQECRTHGRADRRRIP